MQQGRGLDTLSVIIPLYNKQADIELTLHSVMAQSLQPREVIVVDDGSTDQSAAIVERMAYPAVRLIRQSNAGVSAARNRAIAEAKGEWVALMDGDDMWHHDYLLNFERMLKLYPDCEAFGTAFRVDDGRRQAIPVHPTEEGVVDFFAESMRGYVLIPSATILRRDLVLRLGGFPEGMRMGEDQYLWTKVARATKIAYSPRELVLYSRGASNRSAASFRGERTRFSLEELYDERESEMSNEYVARVALGKALLQSAGGDSEAARRALEFFAYNRLSKRIERKVRALNALPRFMRAAVLAAYNTLAWIVARKGL